MRRKLLIALAFLLTFGAGTIAHGAVKAVNGLYDGFPIIKLFSGGKELKPPGTPGILYKGTTLVPIGVMRDLGVIVAWDGVKQRVDITLPTRTVPILLPSQQEELSKSVYLVYGSTDDPAKAHQGSGFIIDGKVITAKHVAPGSKNVDVSIDGKWQRVSEYSYVSDKLDAMAFSVTGGKALPYSTELPTVGDYVYAIGYPHGKLTITEGKVLEVLPSNAVVKRDNGIIEYAGNGIKIKHSAKIEPGSSGGPLFSGKGELIGLNIAGGSSDEEGFALAISEVIKEMK